jgi:hypothetical protein
MEYQVMSDCQFTDKQINNFIKRSKDKKGWLNSYKVRSENMKTEDTRKLMKLIVDRKLAFDNLVINFENDKYEISFDWNDKDRLIEDLERFDKSVILDTAMIKLPPDSLLSDSSTFFEQTQWANLRAEWDIIYETLCAYQNGEEIKAHISRFLNISNNKTINKDVREYVALQCRSLICKYKAIKIGWKEIKDIYPSFCDHNQLFLAMISNENKCKFLWFASNNKPQRKYPSESIKLAKISKLHAIVRGMIEDLVKFGEPNNQKHWGLMLEEYNREPYFKLDDILKELDTVAKKDTENNTISEKITDLKKSFSMFEEGWTYDDPQLEYFYECSQGVPWVREPLKNSSNPRVRKALNDWLEADGKFINFEAKISRRLVDSPKVNP